MSEPGDAPASEPGATPTEAPTEAGGDPAPPKARKRRKLSTKRKLLFASTLFLAPLVLLEGGLRLAGWPTDRIRTIRKLANFDQDSFEQAIGVFRPNTTSRVSWPVKLAYTAKINALGLRGPETTLARQPGVFRVLCLGDSTTFGFYVEEEETLPQRLRAYLEAQGKGPLEVINGGCGGWTIRDEEAFFRERASKLDPQLVVLTFCSNDLADLRNPRGGYETQKAQVAEGGGEAKRLLYSTATYELILRVKIAWKHVRMEAANEQPHPLSSIDLEEDEIPGLWARYREHLEALRDQTRARKIPLVVVYLPDAYRIQEKLPEVDAERLGALCEELEIPYANSYERFKVRPVTELYHAPADAHQNAEGNRVLAEVAGELILKLGLVP